MRLIKSMGCADGVARADMGVAFGFNETRRTYLKNHTADATLEKAEKGTAHSNSGAAGAVTLTLPVGPDVGDRFLFYKMTAQNLAVAAGAGSTINNAATFTNATAGDSNVGVLEVTALTSTVWRITKREGTWA